MSKNPVTTSHVITSLTVKDEKGKNYTIHIDKVGDDKYDINLCHTTLERRSTIQTSGHIAGAGGVFDYMVEAFKTHSIVEICVILEKDDILSSVIADLEKFLSEESLRTTRALEI